MNYLKFYSGGNIIKKLVGGGPFSNEEQNEEYNYLIQNGYSPEQAAAQIKRDTMLDVQDFQSNSVYTDMVQHGFSPETAAATADNKKTAEAYSTANTVTTDSTGRTLQEQEDLMTTTTKETGKVTKGLPKMSNQAWGQIAKAGTGAIDAVDNALMGDKNFGAQSQAIDAMVDTTSQALISSGNPYAIAAGFGLKGANFLTKAGGQTVQGYDVDIKSSGYGNLGHKDSSSSRDFGAMIGLGGLNAAATQRKLQKRNEEAQMALKAANVADTIAFEQEARMNSVDDVLQQNQIALDGGIDTSLLVAKKGGKLYYIEDQNWDKINKIISDALANENIVKAKNGAKLESIETSEEPNVIPEGALHKNKHDIDLDGITQKGIPVITVDDPNAETFEDIKASEDSILQHCEVEQSEIIFNKELTLFIENMRKQWHEKDNNDDSICLEAGMRLAKEIIENTEDNTDVTQKAIEAVENENS